MHKRIISIMLLSALLLLSSCGDGSAPEGQPPASESDQPEKLLTYEEYWLMDGKSQAEYYNSFGSDEAFFEWYNAAKAEYDAAHPGVDAGDGEIDLGDLGK